MRNIKSELVEFIRKNPGAKRSEIFSEFKKLSFSEVDSAIYQLEKHGEIICINTGRYIYFVAGEGALERYLLGKNTSDLLDLETTAIELREKHLYRRAATVWQQLCDSITATEDMRDCYVFLKNLCIGYARKPGNSVEDFNLAGRYCGGDL
ncbi:hypothetical protein PT300_15415 [Enterobacteriaceae bacterium ESL0689]|nr:hypothetical protein [Enterobacteriaceae bacterium ESL0689]